MKVGDLVSRSSGILKAYDKDGKQIPQARQEEIGTVVFIHPSGASSNKYFVKLVGTAVDVLWASGTLQENYASRALKVVNEDR